MKPKYQSNDQHLLTEPCYGKTKKIKIWVNGEAECYIFNINPKDFRTWALILYHISQEIKPSFGAVKRLIELESRKVVSSFEELDPTKKYIALGLTCQFKVPIGGYKTNAEIYDAEKLSGKRIPIYKDNQVTENKNFLEQTEKLKNTVIYVAINGKNDPPHKAVFKEHELHDWEMIRSYMAQILSVHDGIKHFCTIYGEVLEDPRDFQHGYLYVAVPFAESFTKLDYRGLFMKKYKFRKSKKNKKAAALKISRRNSKYLKQKTYKQKQPSTTVYPYISDMDKLTQGLDSEIELSTTCYSLSEEGPNPSYKAHTCTYPLDCCIPEPYSTDVKKCTNASTFQKEFLTPPDEPRTVFENYTQDTSDEDENYETLEEASFVESTELIQISKYYELVSPENVNYTEFINEQENNENFVGDECFDIRNNIEYYEELETDNTFTEEDSGEISDDESSITQLYSVKELIRDQENYKQIVDVNSSSEKVINDENKHDSAKELKSENVVLIKSEILKEDLNKSFDDQLNDLEKNENIIKQEISEIYEQFLSGGTLEEHENEERKYFLNSDDRLKYFNPEIKNLDTNNETFTTTEKMFDFKYVELNQQNLIDNIFNSVIFVPDTSIVLSNENLYQEFKSQYNYSPGYLGVPQQENSVICKEEIESCKRIFNNSCSDTLYFKKDNIKSLETRDNNNKEKNNYQQTRTNQKVCNPLLEIIESASNFELEKQNNFIQENTQGADYNYVDKSNLQLENQEQTLPQEVYEHVQQCETCITGEIISQFNNESGNINQLRILPQLCDVKDEIIDPFVYELIINISQCKPKDNEQNLCIMRQDNQDILFVSNYLEESFKHTGQNKNSENFLIDTKCIEQNYTIKEYDKQQIMSQIKFEKDTCEIKHNVEQENNSCQVTYQQFNNTKLATSSLDDDNKIRLTCANLSGELDLTDKFSEETHHSVQKSVSSQLADKEESPENTESQKCEQEGDELENEISERQQNQENYHVLNNKSSSKQLNCLEHKSTSVKSQTDDISNQKTTTYEQENSKEENAYKCLVQKLFLEEEQLEYDYTSPEQCELCTTPDEFDYQDVSQDEFEDLSNSVSGILIENIREQSVTQNINQENLKSFYIATQLSNDLENLLNKVDLVASRQEKSEGTEICQQFIKQVATPVIQLISELQQTMKDPLHSASTSVSLLKEERDVLTEPAEIISSEAQTDGRVTGVPIKTMRKCNFDLHRNIISLPLRFTEMHRAPRRCCEYCRKDSLSLSKCIINITNSIKDYQQKLAEVEQEMDGDPNVKKLIERNLSSTRPSKVSKKCNISTRVI